MATILVTGATGNLGSAIADRFAYAGHTVIGTTTGTVEKSRAADGVVLHQVNLGDERQVDEFVEWMKEQHGVPDVAVFTAGGFSMGNFETTGRKEIMDQLELNFMTTYLPARKILTEMIAAGRGQIFLTAAAGAMDMSQATDRIGYGLSKSLVFRLGEMINAAGKGRGVSSLVLAPAIIDTPQNRKAMPTADFNTWTRPGDIADAVMAVCSGEDMQAVNGVLQFLLRSV